jgi:hypothetical protein
MPPKATSARTSTGPVPDCLGGSLPDVFPRLQTQDCPGILFAAAAIALSGVVMLLEAGVRGATRAYLPLGLRTWGWVDIAVLPLLFASSSSARA